MCCKICIMWILIVLPYRPPVRHAHQTGSGRPVLPYHERYLEWRQAEDVQPHVRGTTVEKLEEAIGQGVLVVCEFHEAYLRYQLDYADYSSHLLHLILLPKKKETSFVNKMICISIISDIIQIINIIYINKKNLT